MGDFSLYVRQDGKPVHERLRPVVRFASPSRRAHFSGFRGGAGSGQLRVVAAHGCGTTAGFGVDVGWRFARKSAEAWLGREWKVLELAGPQPICSPILGPPRNYNCFGALKMAGFVQFMPIAKKSNTDWHEKCQPGTNRVNP